jgi:hypothetical protein
MITCAACGARNADGERFCGECGEYLAWDGKPAEERVAADVAAPTPAPPAPPPPPPPVETPAPPPPAPPPSTVAKPGTAPSTAAKSGPTTVAKPGAAPAVPAEAIGAGAQQGPSPARPASAAEALIVPVTEAAPVQPGRPAGAPEPVKPGRAEGRVAPPDLPPETRRPQPGETICGNCGAGNDPARKFCRRCGASLADAPVAPPRGWWQRLLRRGRAAAPAAGTRPRRTVRRSYRGPVVLLLVLALLGAAGFQYRALIRSGVEAVLDRVKGSRLETPVGVKASRFVAGHPASKADDGASNTFWSPGTPENAKGAWLQVKFDHPFRLVQLITLNGASDQQPVFSADARPHLVRLELTRATGPKVTQEFELDDVAGPQRHYVGVSDVTVARITLVTFREPRPGRLVALAEVEYYARK